MTGRSFRFGYGLLNTHHCTKPSATCLFTYLLYLYNFDLFARNKWFEKCENYLTAELKDFIWANINTTSGCCVNKTCWSVENKIILGKLFNGRVCACCPIFINNPDGKTLEYAKELALIGKTIIAETAESSIK